MSDRIPWTEIRAAAKRDPHVRMVLADRAGRGVRLTAREVSRMVRLDDAIATAAESFFEDDERELPEDFRR